MKKAKRILEKKYMSTLVIAAFLALSVLTANNLRMRDQSGGGAGEEARETLSQEGNRGSLYQAETDDENENSTENDLRNRNSNDSRDQSAGSREDKEENSALSDDDQDQTVNLKEKEETKTDNLHFKSSDRLTWPVLGNVILPYSMDTTVYYMTLDQYAANDGILIGAKTGAEVKAGADGRIVNITESDRYGKMVTMLIGDYYELTYGQIDKVEYEIGDELKQGDILGKVAEPTRSFLLEGPHLFFRMTCKGQSVNPADYLQ